jgi:uncharacterized protein (DUF488 family)
MATTGQILTVGHSTHPAEEFVALVRTHGVEVVCDVRRFPASGRNPQFNAHALRESLAGAQIAYEPFGEELGGRRRPTRPAGESPWRVEGFRGYAEYMETPPFQTGLERLEEVARERRAAVMCAEGNWRRCHRRLIADALTARGWLVIHIGPDSRIEEHQPMLG